MALCAVLFEWYNVLQCNKLKIFIFDSQGETGKEKFCETVIKILEKRFVYFGEKSVRNKIPVNARVSMEIVNYLLKDSNEVALRQGLLSIYDEICNVKSIYNKEEKKSIKKKQENKTDNENGDILLQTTKIQNNLSFSRQFQYYFDGLTQNDNISADLKTFLAIILVELGVFWYIKDTMWGISLGKLDSQDPVGEENKLTTLMKEYKELGLLNVAIHDDLKHSLFHEVVTFDSSEPLAMLLTLDNDPSKYHNIDGTAPVDVAIKYGNWSHVQQIALAKMGQKMKDKAKTEEKRIEAKRGIVNTFIKQRQKMAKKAEETKDEVKDEMTGEMKDKLLEDLLVTVLNLIEEQAAISDDMLYLCWKYEMNKMKNEPNHSTNRLWVVLKKVIFNVLEDTKNKQKWIWFKKNLLSSVIWYELVSFDASDPVLLSAINAVGGGRDNASNDDSSSNSNENRLFCDCGTMYELTLPISTLRRHWIQCIDCNQYSYHNRYFYHCPNSTANKHSRTDLCLQCSRKRKENMTKSASTTAETGETAVTAVTTTTQAKQSNKKSKQQQHFILYAELFGMANDKLNKEKLKLKEKIDKISSHQAWKHMVNKQLPKNSQVRSKDLRQDSSELLTFPTQVGFDPKKLTKLGLKDFYDVKVYLPKLLIVASALDDKFHDTLKNDILRKDMTVNYTRGPLKRIERCQAKGTPFLIFFFVRDHSLLVCLLCSFRFVVSLFS